MTYEIIVEFPSSLTEAEKNMIYGYKGELVRCKDCIYNYANMFPDCDDYCRKHRLLYAINGEDFCSMGERKDETL